MVKALSWAEDVDEGIDEEVVEEVNDNDKDELAEVGEIEEIGVAVLEVKIDEEVVAEVKDKDELVKEIEEIDVAVLEVKIEAEVDKEVVNVVGVAVVVKEGIAVVVSGVEATNDEAGEVEPPNVHNDPNGIYSRRLKPYNAIFNKL